jgi:cyclophilin family peptidyl-prolyl cis-trans isomerase
MRHVWSIKQASVLVVLPVVVLAIVLAVAPAGVSAWQAAPAKHAAPAKPAAATPAKPATQAPAGRRGTGGATTAGPSTAARGAVATAEPKRSPGAGPVIVIETVKGTIQFETYPNEAPKSVEHILALVKRNFYNGMRVHRVAPGFVVQFGDPFSRDMSKKEQWGTGGSYNVIGELEANPKRTHGLGAVAVAHPGDPRQGDSQIYITLAPVHRLDGKYSVIGQVISGMDVVQKLAVPDVIRRISVKP